MPQLAISMLFSLFVSAGALAGEDAIMRGVGVSRCADFTSNYRKQSKVAEMLYGTWAIAFLAVINMQLVADGKPRRLLPGPIDLFEGLKQVCVKKPDVAVYQALVSEGPIKLSASHMEA
jgi:hypothetical protein